MRALKTKLRRNAQNELPDSRYAQLIVQLEGLEDINKIYMDYIDWLRSSCSVIRLPTLFSEIFDIPISSKSSSSSAISGSIGDELDDTETAEEFNEDQCGRVLSSSCTTFGTIETDSRLRQVGKSLPDDNTNDLVELELDQPSDQDVFFKSLVGGFQDSDDKIDAADLNPSVECLDSGALDHHPLVSN